MSFQKEGILDNSKKYFGWEIFFRMVAMSKFALNSFMFD